MDMFAVQAFSSPMALTQLLSTQMGQPAGMPAAGFAFGFGRDAFNPTAELFERGGSGCGMPSFMAASQFGVMGGMGTVPGMTMGGLGSMGMGGLSGLGGMCGGWPAMMGMGGFGAGSVNQMMPQMAGLMMGMGMMMGMMMARGGQGMNPGMMGMGGPGMVGGMQPPCMKPPCRGGGPIELQKGSSYTTPGGSTISWQGDKVDVKESGGASRSMGTMGGGMAFAGMYAQTNQGTAFAMAGVMVGGTAGAGMQAAQPRNWNVWGDPHIKNPDGSQGEFSDGAKGAQGNGMFTLQDGTRVVMEAQGAKSTVDKVLIFPPGSELSGFDPNTTTDWGNGADGKFHNMGTVAQTGGMGGMQGMMGGMQGMMGGGFGNPLQMMMGGAWA